MDPSFFKSLFALIWKANEHLEKQEKIREENKKEKEIAKAQVVNSIHGEVWGFRTFWFLAIALAITATFNSELPTFWRWLFGVSGFITFPICLSISPNKDEKISLPCG